MPATDLVAWMGITTTQYAVRPTTPPLSFLKFPPSSIPATLPPPPKEPTLAHPFEIPGDIYNALLSPNVPITVALVYATAVSVMNRVNANRKYRPWAFSQTRLFKILVILHNAFLAVYSLWTFVGMVNALRLSLESPRSEYGMVGFVDSLCKMNGPRGLGAAATYNASTSAWGIVNRAFHLAADGLTPETTDVGRMWNEGLAFYGWLFYISKFYEVIDTMIILVKGKKSSLLQTYHHAGAMLCMWAGIRYMSPPIWMFVLVNSGVHTIMYSFYLCGVLSVRIPTWFKRTLTTLQITQFVVGTVYAFLHLFVGYRIPVSVPYLYHLGDIAAAVPSDVSSVASVAMATASANAGAWLKKAVFRAAGREGLAENVRNDQGQTFGIDAVHAARDLVRRQETRYREEQQWIHCLDTSGQTFAILLNCLYLLPLTFLFGQFFIQSYLRRVERRRSSSPSEKAAIAGKSGRDALLGVSRRLSEAFEDKQGGINGLGDEDAVLVDGDELKKEIADAMAKARQTASESTSKAAEKLKSAASTANNLGSAAIEKAKEAAAEIPHAEELSKSAKKRLKKAQKQSADAANQVAESIDPSDETKQKVGDGVKNAVESVKSTASKASEKIANGVDDLPNLDEAKQQAQDVKGSAEKKTASAKQKSKDVLDDAQAHETENNEAKSSTSSSSTDSKSSDTEFKATTGVESEKKEEDKIIDESQTIRDEDVDTKATSEGNDAHVKKDESFADAVKKDKNAEDPSTTPPPSSPTTHPSSTTPSTSPAQSSPSSSFHLVEHPSPPDSPGSSRWHARRRG